MDTDPKELQGLAAPKETAMEWSTISHTHAGVQKPEDANNLIKQLQGLAAPKETATDWSTISHTHVGVQKPEDAAARSAQM